MKLSELKNLRVNIHTLDGKSFVGIAKEYVCPKDYPENAHIVLDCYGEGRIKIYVKSIKDVYIVQEYDPPLPNPTEEEWEELQQYMLHFNRPAK